jgi:UMF1 family MFS transporter
MTVPGNGRGAVIGWCLYDWAMSAFNTVIGTFVFSVYFSRGIVGNEVEGPALWAQAVAISGFFVLILSPFLGGVADHGGRRKTWLAAFTVAALVPTALLWFSAPTPDSIVPTMILIVLATVAFELTYVFYNTLLLDVAPPERLGRVSGLGWGLGYAGGLVCLTVALFGLVGLGDSPPLLPLSTEGSENLRATGPLVALWWAIFALPLFLLVRERPGGLPLHQALSRGFHGLLGAFDWVRTKPGMLRFLIASAIYREGFNVLFAMGGIYAAGTFGLSFTELLIFAIGLNVTSAIGAIAFGHLDDRIGSKPTILLALAGLIALGIPIILVGDKMVFIVLALVIGLFMGPAQAASRTLMGRLAPAGGEGEAYGLYSLTGRATGFVGPLLYALGTSVFESQRAGMAVIILLFGLGFILLVPLSVRRRPEPA